jgi:IS5 family transposase
MHSTQKGNQRYFGMKAHIGIDKSNWLVHSLTCTSAEVHDSQMMDQLLHWKEKEIYGDGAYADKEKMDKSIFRGIFWLVCRRGYKNKPLTQDDKNRNRFCSAVRSKVERVFWVIKDLRWHRKVHYKWIHKNEMQRYMLCGLTNMYRMRNKLIA